MELGARSPVLGSLLLLAGLGGAGLAAAGVRPGPLPVVPTVAGSLVVAALGFGLLVYAVTRPTPAPVPKPAHLAFLEKKEPLPPAKLLAAQAHRAARRGLEEAPEPPRMTPEAAAQAKLEGQIREISRQIDRAKVMYGMGKLSPDGYSAYVRELEAKRGELEARLVRLTVRTNGLT